MFRFICCFFVLFSLLGCRTTEEKPFTVVSGGKAHCVIALPENAGKFDRMAAEDLKNYLNRLTGAEFRIVPEEQLTERAICVGPSQAARQAGLTDLKDEEWCIASPDGKKLILTGGRKIGAFYAAWSLLNQFGCYAITWDQDAIPDRKDDLTYSGNFERKKPAFSGRMIADGSVPLFVKTRVAPEVRKAYNRWLLRSRINGEQNKKNPALYTYGSFHLAQPRPFHSLSLYVPAKKYFKTHPEYFSMNESGKRFPPRSFAKAGSLCMSNPEVAQIALQSLREMIRLDRSQNPKEEWATVYDISTLDQSPYICKCPECTAFSKANGSETDLLLHFINTIAREIRKEYPDIVIRTFGYSASYTPPAKVFPESNVLIQLTDKFSQSDPFVPLSHPFNARQLPYFEAWSKSTKRLGVWDYWNLGGPRYFNPPRVETVFNALQSDFRFFRSIGITEIFIEAGRSPVAPQNFIDLAYFTANMLMIDPDDDPQKLADIFLNAYYGPAAPQMRAWFHEICDGVAKHQGRQTSMTVSHWDFATPEFMLRSYTMLKKAAESLPEGNIYRERVERERITVLWSILSHRYSYEKLFASHGIKMNDLIAECRSLSYAYIHRFPCTNPKPVEKEFEGLFSACVNNLPRPPEFKNVPEENYRMIAWPNMRGTLRLGSTIADDPESLQKKALKSASPDPAFHGVNKLMPGEHKFRTTFFKLGNHKAPGVSLLLKEVPQDEKYHWFRLPGKIELQPNSSFWGQGGAIQANTSHLYVLTDGSSADNTWDEIWMSAKFTGPAYVNGSKKENAIWVDMVVLIRGNRK